MKVLFFAWLKTEIIEEDIIEIKDSITVNQLKDILVKKYGEKANLLYDNSILVAINHEYKSNTDTLKNTDEVAFFPPVTGG